MEKTPYEVIALNPIAKKIQEARLKAKMSEKELAKKCGLSAGYISQIESGRKIINETAAAAILKVFGESMESSYSEYLDADTPAPVARPVVKSVAAMKPVPVHEPVQVEANDQWAGALVNIIKEFPVNDIRSGKRVGRKELPILNKKIEEIPWEKLLFFMASDDDAIGLRIGKGDLLWVHEMKELQGEGVYLLEWQNRKQVFRIQKLQGQLGLGQGAVGSKPTIVNLKDIRILGKCIRVECVL